MEELREERGREGLKTARTRASERRKRAGGCNFTSVQQGGAPACDGRSFAGDGASEDVEDVVAVGVQRHQLFVGDGRVAEKLDL